MRTVYLRTIAVHSSDITPTLSFGISLDHVVSIICAVLGGMVWGPGDLSIFSFWRPRSRW